MAKVEKQKERISELLRLIAENPTLRIIPMVETNVVASDDWAWWTASWGSASIEEIYTSDERCYVRSQDEDELIDDVYNTLEDADGFSDDEMYVRAKIMVEQYEWEKVIAVKITI